MGHVNNAVYATYFEQPRSAYYPGMIGVRLDQVRIVLARTEIEYRRPIDLDQSVNVAMWTGDLGESSLKPSYEVRADGDVAATAGTGQVVMDEAGTEPRPLPEEWRERVEQHRAHR